MKKTRFLLILILFIILALPSHAYIDPGTGSMLFSIILCSVTSIIFLLNSLIIKFKSSFFVEKSLGKNKHKFVIYSEGNQYFPVFKPILDEFEKRQIEIIYYTSAEQDLVFAENYKFVKSEFIGKGNKAYFKLAFLNADICLMTTPGLDVFHLKRSKYVKYYCHIFHAVTSCLNYRLFSLDYYDCVLCDANFQVDLIREIERKRNLPAKDLVVVGCTYMDFLQEKLKQIKSIKDKFTVLVAPSWGESAILTKYGSEFIDKLIETNFNIIIRPHPQSLLVEKELIDSLSKKYKDNENISWNFDSENLQVLSEADILISDFSSVLFDYAFLFNKPFIYVNKEMNPEIYDISDLDKLPWRYEAIKKIGTELTKDNFKNISSIINNLSNNDEILSEIQKAKEYSWENRGFAANKIVDFLIEKQEALNIND